MRPVAAARRAAGMGAGAGRAVGRYVARSAHPPSDGPFSVRGADGRIDVVRDRHGIPHVLATSEADACFGHGFVHAQDRLFQAEAARRLAAGRLSEVAGAATLASDRLMRRIGLARAVERDAREVDDRTGTLLQAYARGMNEGVRHLKALPPEFALLGDRFEPWRLPDVMLVGRLILFGFAGNWNTELTRERLAAAIGPERAAALDPVHPPTSTVTGETYAGAAERLLEAYRAAVDAGLPAGAASNAWAVTSRRTSTGAPLLASDPHVDVSLPCLFHVAHLRGGDLDVVGAGIAGVPGVVIGHNRVIAWGITAGMADVADCYVEEFDPDDRRRYRTHRGWAEADEVVERIEVLDGDAVEERVLLTRHGPVVSPLLAGERRAIALRSTVVEGGDIAAPFIALWRAGSLDEALHAVEGWPGTTFNFVFASIEDRVAYRFAGQAPQRRAGEGLLPQRGEESAGPPACWPAEVLPRVVDPASGVIVSANNAPGGPLELGEEWSEPRRAERIRALLDERERHDLASFAAIQGDRYSANLVRLRNLLLARGAPEPPSALLEAWDGRLDPDSAGGAVAAATYRALVLDAAERLAGGRARLLLGQAIEGLSVASAFSYRAQDPIITAAERASEPWFAGPEDRDRRLLGALERGCSLLRARCGADPGGWRLGAITRLPLAHPLGDVPAIGRVFSRGDRPFGGDFNTVAQGGTLPWHEDGRVAIAPGYRQLLDLADWDRSVFMLPTGNSGIPGHSHYLDCLDEYLAGHYRPLLFSTEAVEAAAEHRLVLQPAGAA